MIKYISYLPFLLLMFIGSSSLSQENLSPSNTQTLIILEVLNPDDSPYANALVLFKDKYKKEYKAKTNNKGVLKILLPNGNKYIMKCGKLKNELLINVSNRAYATWSGKRYTFRFIEFTFNFRDYQNNPVNEEEIFIALGPGDTLSKQTDPNGNATFYIPIKENFKVRTKYKTIEKFEIPDEGYEAISFSFNYRGQSAKDYEQKQKEARLAQLEYEKQKKIRDSIYRREDSIRSTQPTIVIFFASDREMKHLGEISVYEGDKEGEKLGSVNSVWSCHSGPSIEKAETKVEKMKGNYKYYAKSSGGYEWKGSYDINGGGTKRVIIEINEGKKIVN